MSVDVTIKDGGWLNPEMLRWAREWRGRSIDEVARKLKKDPEQILAWESDEATPTVKQARKLAEFYGRSFVEFFLLKPPTIKEAAPIADFRMHTGVEEPLEVRDVKLIQQWAETRRQSALDLYEDLGDAPPSVPDRLFATENADAEGTAALARDFLGFTVEEQLGIKKSESYKLPSILRGKIENFGVLTLKNSNLKDHDIRGICIAKFPLPVIVYGSESPTAQAFTIAHEFAHVLLQLGGVSGAPQKKYLKHNPIEKWCDLFAAAFLMPAELIQKLIGDPAKKPLVEMPDEVIDHLASSFRVSPHAMVIRLVHLKYVKSSFYWDVKKKEFDSEERKYKPFGRAPYYGSRYRNTAGDLYTGLVLEAWSSGRLTNHNAAEYMGIKNIQHLNDIRDRFNAS